MTIHKKILLLSAICSLIAVGAQAAATLKVGKVSGKAGATVSVPVTLNSAPGSVASLQFDLTLPIGVSTVSVTAGSLMTASGKSVSANLKENVWTFLVYGAKNKNAIEKGLLLTALVRIAPGTAAGTLSVPISNTVYVGADGEAVKGGPGVGGFIKVIP